MPVYCGFPNSFQDQAMLPSEKKSFPFFLDLTAL